jgi:hypothetical protein
MFDGLTADGGCRMRKIFATFMMLSLLLGVSFALPGNAAASVIYPLVVPSSYNAISGKPVTFHVTTSVRVTQIQTVIDGTSGKKYTEYTEGVGVRKWIVTITFTTVGDRKVEFRCKMTSGTLAMIPKSPVVIHVTSAANYSATSTTKSLTSGKTVYFSVGTPSAIDKLYALVDGVKQTKIGTTVISDKNGIKKWKISIAFFKVGIRSVKFTAYTGTTLKKTFPSTALTLTVK